MNNSLLEIDDREETDIKPHLRQKETEAIEIVEAINQITQDRAWLVLKRRIFDSLVENLEKQLLSESVRKELNTGEIYRLSGQLLWAKRYSDLNKLADSYKLELGNIRNKLNGENN